MKKKRHPFLLLVLILCLLAGVEYYLSNNAVRLETVEFCSSRLPKAFDGFTVVHLSDIHAKSFGEDNDGLISKVKQANPDIIVITGDLIERTSELAYAADLFSRLTPIAPVYYTTGNHEWGAEWAASRLGMKRLMPELKTLMDSRGVTYIDNRAVTLKRGQDIIWLAGLCDPNGPILSKSLSEILAEPRADGDPYILLMAHRYDMYDEYVEANVDLTFAGHAHGGVVRLPFTDGMMGPNRELWPEHTSGLYIDQKNSPRKTAVHVSRGIGDTYMPRFLNRPHVAAIVLRSEEG